MFGNFNTQTARWFLDLLGFACLFIACALHSWTWDAVGIALLVIATLMDPPSFVLKALTTVAAAFALEHAPPVLAVGVSPWEMADRAYVQAIIRERDTPVEEQLTFPYMTDALDYEEEQSEYLRKGCAYRITPCGRPTEVRAWGDLH